MVFIKTYEYSHICTVSVQNHVTCPSVALQYKLFRLYNMDVHDHQIKNSMGTWIYPHALTGNLKLTSNLLLAVSISKTILTAPMLLCARWIAR